jgi:hypothetical protein
MRFCGHEIEGAVRTVNTTVFVVLLVVGILAVLALIWTVILVWLRRRSRAVAEQLGAELAGETVLCAPEKGSYRGATASGYPTVKNTGLIALTGRRIVFAPSRERRLTFPSSRLPVCGRRRCSRVRWWAARNI